MVHWICLRDVKWIGRWTIPWSGPREPRRVEKMWCRAKFEKFKVMFYLSRLHSCRPDPNEVHRPTMAMIFQAFPLDYFCTKVRNHKHSTSNISIFLIRSYNIINTRYDMNPVISVDYTGLFSIRCTRLSSSLASATLSRSSISWDENGIIVARRYLQSLPKLQRTRRQARNTRRLPKLNLRVSRERPYSYCEPRQNKIPFDVGTAAAECRHRI